MFAHDLFGAQIPTDAEYNAEVLARNDPQVRQDVLHMKAHVPSFLSNCLQRISWGEYDIIGFSSKFEQNLASLSLARRVKESFPRLIIVFGGANCEGVMGLTLHRCFPFVDYVVTGEGDVAFPQLVQRLAKGESVDHLRGVVSRREGVSIDNGSPEKIADLDALPFPNFDEYFDILEGTGAPFADRHVTVETARGCWVRRHSARSVA